MNTFKRRLALATLLSCGFGSAHADVVISQVYGGGGNSSAPLNRDFIELHNNGSTSVSLSGWSVQYASATGTSWQVTTLSGSIAPGAYYLVHQGTVGANGVALPTADAVGSISMSGTAGKVALSTGTTALTGSCPTGNADFVGFGATANCAEASAPTPAPSNTLAVIRADGGCTDTNNNAADFVAASPNPRNSASTSFNCGPTIPVLSIADQARRERNAMSQAEAFSVQLSQPAGVGGVSFSYTVTAGTATSGVDYIGTGGNATIPEGASTGFVSFAITGDTDIEGDETVLVTLGDIVGASAGDTAAVITITDDDAPPQISISDASAAEGDSGTTQFLFTISLGSPAPQGGVSVDYATADGTAAAGSDYVAKSAAASIAEGQTSITIGVDVNGDDDIEGNETFFVNLSNAVGGTLSDVQGVGTITNDDVVITPIHDIQGAGASSPLVDQVLNTRGIVTGRKSNGFFMQSPDADADADPATSEGIFVFTSTTPPAAAAIGNLVRVSGKVVEFVPAQDPLQAPLTELGGSLTVNLLTTGNPLPTPVQLTTSFPSPGGGLDQLERVEGMRVTADSFTVVAATGGNTDENNATGSSNGQVNLVVTGTPRPFREPGIQTPDPAPAGGSIPPIPRWDFNPELLFSDTDALGGTRLDLAVGATLSNYVGPLDYGFRRYSVHQDPTVTPTVTPGPAPAAARVPGAREFTVASYNLERFFDTLNDPTTDDPVLTSTAFTNRLVKASLGIRDFLHSPDILAVMEVENLSALQMLSTRVSTDAMTAGHPNPKYVAYLAEGNDVGGIDVGFLVKTGEVADGVARVEVVGAVTQLGADTTWNDPVNGPGTLLNDRPPLLLDAVVHFADGREFPVTVIAVHQRSLNGADTDDAGGNRTRTKRQLQADFLADQIQAMQEAAPERRIVVAGDFNAFEFNDGLVDAMGTVTGLPSPDDATAVANDGIDRVSPDLLNLYIEEPVDQRYSFEFDGNAQSLDHILVNQALGAAASGIGLDHARINSDFPEVLRGDMTTVARLADHDPALAYFGVDSANLATTASANPVNVGVGGTLTFEAIVRNSGPDAAESVGVGFALDAEVPDLAVTAPAGWSCDTPTVGPGTTTVACNMSSMPNPGYAFFRLTGTVPESDPGSTINLAVLATAATPDPDETDNAAAATANVLSVDLATSITGPVRNASTVTYTVVVHNNGPSPAPHVILTINSNIPMSIVTFSNANPYWTCGPPMGGPLVTTCLKFPGNGPIPVGGSVQFTITIPHDRNKSSYWLESEVVSYIEDPAPANNYARRRLAMPQP